MEDLRINEIYSNKDHTESPLKLCQCENYKNPKYDGIFRQIEGVKVIKILGKGAQGQVVLCESKSIIREYS